jgi:hypothetical protein
MHLWQMVKDLFETDDGSLPDIFIEGLEANQVIRVIEWLAALAGPLPPVTVWSRKDETELEMDKLENAAFEVISGNIDPFRVNVGGLAIHGIRLPEMTVFIDKNEIAFDYRMGPSWNEVTVMALFDLLAGIKGIAPNAAIFQAFEGYYQNPNNSFRTAFELYLKTAPSNKSSHSAN